MKLLTKEIMARLPKLNSQDGKDPTTVPIIVKFESTFDGWAWYVIAGEQDGCGDWQFYGLVVGDCTELGYFSLMDLGEMGVERDKSYGYDHKLSDVME